MTAVTSSQSEIDYYMYIETIYIYDHFTKSIVPTMWHSLNSAIPSYLDSSTRAVWC